MPLRVFETLDNPFRRPTNSIQPWTSLRREEQKEGRQEIKRLLG